MYRRFSRFKFPAVCSTIVSLPGSRRFSPRISGRKKQQLEGIRRESRWFPPPSALRVLARSSFGFGTPVSLFLPRFVPTSRGIRDVRFPPFSRPRVLSDPSALKMYINLVLDRGVVLSRRHMAWNLKGVVKNNACPGDFSDDGAGREDRVIRSPCVFLPPEAFGITCWIMQRYPEKRSGYFQMYRTRTRFREAKCVYALL